MYMPERPVYGLSTLHGESLVLQSVTVDVVFNNLLCETAITQTYGNQEQDPIEAVYTFPLTTQAVLLDTEVRIGERTLRGHVVKNAVAEEQYEEAIAQGDAAIMLEQVQTGLYTMNVGNILAGEQVVVTIKTAELHTWNEKTLRFFCRPLLLPAVAIRNRRDCSPSGSGNCPA
jgi:Ca-activated chloride channel family protein